MIKGIRLDLGNRDLRLRFGGGSFLHFASFSIQGEMKFLSLYDDVPPDLGRGKPLAGNGREASCFWFFALFSSSSNELPEGGPPKALCGLTLL